ncbi:presqualene diphosphate synthase HpnD [Emcibacter sp. SYSU 3D8]|uniref:presqualene diphosphate synthase HpnD n=1 Tax=Emcibacter sp. SYSU 3D8 TaxID=3133969 RepID=UPI0031FF1B01
MTAAGSSFYWAMRFLPPEKRDAIFAVYAFAREVDDIADGDDPDDVKRAGLESWRAEIEALYQGVPQHPITRVIAPAISTYHLEKKDFIALIDGMEMDGIGPIRAPVMDELILYCDRVACAVGRLCVCIFGEPGPAGQAVADHLGLALQLTNILRDIEEDAAMGRLYLPRELLAQAGIEGDEPGTVIADPRLRETCRALAVRAEEEFRLADTAIARCSRKAMRPAIIMMMVYRKTLDRLLEEDWSYLPNSPRNGVSKLEKLWIAVRYGLF